MTQICTTIEQSKKLAEILPLESADMHWQYIEEDNGQLQWFCFPKDFSINQHNTFSAWSLAALLDLLECPVLQKDKIGDGKEAWMVSCYPDGARVDSYWNESPIDACVKMIVKLKEDFNGNESKER